MCPSNAKKKGKKLFLQLDLFVIEIFRWCKSIENADPVLFIHPDEDDVCGKARKAAARGIAGFKMMCNKIYDELGVNEDIRERIYEKNYLRFMGRPV